MFGSKKKERVAVGISGGVDSSVAAYLLKKQGYDVIGIFVKTWSPDWLPCTWVDEKRDAMRVCAQLDIPFYFLDAEEEYKKGVAEYMVSEYAKGRTPNPDVFCNRVIKFGALWDYAQKLGATKIATGHYVDIDEYGLKKAGDESKDQAYFLWMLRKEEFKHILFPIGKYQKEEVRKIAREINLFTGDKKDSQGICFLGDVDMREFLSHYIEQKKGDVKNLEGEIIGEHDGVWFYTIGERHGFKITTKDSNRKKYYVVGKNIEENVLIVSENRKREDFVNPIIKLENTSWHLDIDFNQKYTAQIRYHGSFIDCEIVDENTIKLFTDEIISLGQSVVIYKDERVVGGGIMDEIVFLK